MENNKLESIKERIMELYKKTDIIHVSLNQKRKKINSVEAKITGVYNNFITVTSIVNGYNESFSISFVDLMLENTIIMELN